MAVNNKAQATYGGSLSNVNEPQDGSGPEAEEEVSEPGPAEFLVQGRSETYEQDEKNRTRIKYTTVFRNVHGDRFIVETSSPIAVANVTAVLVPKKS